MFRLTLVALLLLAGCATTTVTKNPSEADKGIRYYRPKPYLLVQPTGSTSDESVTISLEYLPDFSEEYSIRVRAGLGINQTNVKLEDGWNLTQIDQKLDSQFDESVKAIGDLIGNLPIPTAGKASAAAAVKLVVKATNVPLGFYEAIVARGDDGKKHLYGWHYVGFYPFYACPTSASGEECIDCHATDVYGLVFERGVMTFKPLGAIPYGDSGRAVLDATSLDRLPPIDAISRPALENVRAKALAQLHETAWGRTVTLDQIRARQAGAKTVAVTVTLPAEDLDRVARQFPEAVAELETRLLPAVRRAMLDESSLVQVELIP